MKPKRLIEALVVHIARLVDGSIAHGAEGGVRVHPPSRPHRRCRGNDRVTLRKRVSGIDETIRRPVVIEAQRIRCSLFVRVPAAKNGAETVGVSNPDRVSIQAHTSLFSAALARMPLRVSTFISRPDADAVWR